MSILANTPDVASYATSLYVFEAALHSDLIRRTPRGISARRRPPHLALHSCDLQTSCCIGCNIAGNQLQPLVVPQLSQTKQEPAGRIRTPQVEQ